MDTNDDKKVFDEEAIAEEEFVADLEDTIENPLVYDGDKITVQNKVESEPTEQKEELTGAIGTGDLTPEIEPFNNEDALRSENVNNDGNPFGTDSTSEKAFGGPDTAPLDNASETIAPSGDAAFGAANSGAEETPGVTDFSTSETTDTASTSEPTIEQLANEATAPAAPVAEAEKPADNIAPLGGTPAATTPNAAEPKKGKKGLIIGIVVAVLVLAAIVGGVIFYIMHESKERVLADAVSGIWSAEARQFDGKVTMTPNEEKNSSTVKSATIDFKADNKSTNFSGTGSLTVNFDGSNPLTIEVSGAYISGDGIFVKLGNLEKTIKDLDLGAAIGIDGDDAAEAKIYEKVLSAVAKKIDGTWYKINAETFGSAKEAQESYECLTKALDEMSSKDVKNKIADIYKAHPFVIPADKDNESADGLTYYYVKVNEEESKAFGKDVEELNVFKDMKACLSSSTSVGNNSSSSSEDEDKDNTTSEIKLGIKGWSHELQSIKGTIKSDSMTLELDAKIGYENKDVTAPSGDTTNIADAANELISTAKDAFKEGYLEAVAEMCKETAKGNQNTYNACYKQYQSQIDQMIDSMFGEIGGDIIDTSMLLGSGDEEEE